MSRTRVLVADDHAMVRRGIAAILANHSDLELAGEAENLRQLLERIREGDWDVVLMDLSMPGGSGLDMLKLIKHHWPKLSVLVVSMHPEEQFAIRVLKAGASGYLAKESAPHELVNAIRTVIAGRRYVSPDLASRLAGALGEETLGEPHEKLSDREFQVLRMIGQGLTVTEIADELKLSPKTVSTYRARLLEKMEMENNAELMRYAIEHSLAE